ncbi:UDP-galactose-4-epimerase [Parapedobacter defluvii]|uniref:UDP-galactose-4-epimerase n=1 Tax=Parapedobacter defluvii TaxID=2045106 RepID=A0ABQ1MEH6_9SPHI|nr:NAD-dependent epimerase/dehydratase family protein [Parapedobacter defluvii]GGC38835.1 UDP-galactose-4-epimerase [Parapedobacter defluvii]
MVLDFFLTGSTGFLGRVICKYLSNSQYTYSELRKNSQGAVLNSLYRLDPSLISRTVVHLAGKAHSIPRTKEEENEFFQTNFGGTRNLCKALESLSALPDNFIFVSTVAVYGLVEGEDIIENMPLNGITSYAKSKIMAEFWLKEWAVKNRVRLSILRLPLIAGPNPPGNLDAMINGIKSGKYLSIGRADARKSMVWVEDIARIIPKLVEKGGIYNLTDGYHPTFGELEESISKALGKRKPIKVPYWLANGLAKTGDIVGRFPINSDKLQKITSTLTFDDSKARKELGWNPTPVLSKIEEIV